MKEEINLMGQLDINNDGANVPSNSSEEIIPPYNKPLSEIRRSEEQRKLEAYKRENDTTSNIRDLATYAFYAAKKGSNKGIIKVIDFLYGEGDIVGTQAALANMTEEEYVNKWKSNQGEKYVEDRLRELEKEDEYRAGMVRTAAQINKDLANQQIVALDSMSNKATQFTAQFAGGVVESMFDITEAPKSAVVNFAVGSLGIGNKIVRTGVEMGADFADNYFTQFYEADLLGEEKPDTSEAVINAASGVVAQRALGIVAKGVKGGMTTLASKFNAANIPSKAGDMVTSIKQIAKDVIQSDNPGVDVEVKSFQHKMNSEPETNYNPALDPRNVDNDPMSRMYDTDIPNTPTDMYVKNEIGQQIKLDFRTDAVSEIEADIKTGKIDQEVGDALIEIETLKNKTDYVDPPQGQRLMEEAEMLLQELRDGLSSEQEAKNKVDPIMDEVKSQDEFNTKIEDIRKRAIEGKEDLESIKKELSEIKAKIENKAKDVGVSNKQKEIPNITEPSKNLSDPVYISDKDLGLKRLQSPISAIGESYIVINQDKTRTLMFKDSDRGVVLMTYDDTRIKSPIGEKPEVAYKSQEELWMDITKYTSRVEKITQDGKTISINGSAKNAYYAKYRGMIAKDKMAKFVTKAGRRYQALEDPNLDSSKVKTNIDASAQVQAVKIIAEINSRKDAIIGATKQFFDHILGQYFYDYDDLNRNINNQVLAEMIVSGDTDAPIFKQEMPPEVKDSLKRFVKYLIDRDTRLVSMNNKLELTSDDLSVLGFKKYDKIFKIDDDGKIEFNTDVGGFFENVDPREKVLELILNQHQISEGKYKGYLEDVQLFHELVLGATPIDRQNGMAIELAFKDNQDDIDLAEQLGFISRDDNGEIVTTVQDFLNGLKFVLDELYDSDSKYDKDKLIQFLDKLGAEDVLPQREHLNKSGSREMLPVKPIDFILFNAENREVDVADLFGTFADYVNKLDEYAQKVIAEEGSFVQANALTADQKEFNRKTSKSALDILNSIRKVVDSENRANPYMQTQKYAKMKEDLINHIQYLIDKNYIDYDIKKLEDLKAQKYSGNLTDDNVVGFIKDVLEFADNDYLLADSASKRISAVKEKLGRKKLIGDLSKDKDYKEAIKAIKKYAQNNKFDQEVLDNLSSNNAVIVRQTLKKIESGANDILSSIKSMREFISELEGSETTPSAYLSNQRNRSKAKTFLENIERILGDVEGLDDIKSFVDYYGNEYDYKLDKKKWLKDIDELRSELTKIQEVSTDGDYKSKRGNFKALNNAYNKLKTMVNENVSMKSLKFIKKNTKNDLISSINEFKQAGKDLNISTDQLESVTTMLKNLMEVIDLVDESKNGTPIIRKQRGNTERFARVTSAEKQKYGRLASVINMKNWLKDKGMFVRVSQEKIDVAKKAGFDMDSQTIELETIPWDNLEGNMDGLFEKYVAPEFKQRFKNLYSHAVQYFSPVREVVDGKMIERPMTIDEFTRIYVDFLRDLSNTTQMAKIQATLDPIKNMQLEEGMAVLNPSRKAMYIKHLSSYFDSDEDMIAFFTRRDANITGSYVLSNDAIIQKYTTKHGEALAEIATVGNSLARFAYQLKKNDTALASLMKKYEPVVYREDGSVIGKSSVDVTKNLTIAIGSKLSNYATPVYAGSGVKGYSDIEFDIKQFVRNAVNLTRDTILLGKGVIEFPFRFLRTTRDMMIPDYKARVEGADSIAQLNLKQIYALIRGSGYGFAAALTAPYNLGIQTLNMVGKIGQYLQLEKAINNVLSKHGISEVEFNIPKKHEITPLSIYKRLNPKKKAMVNAMRNYFEMRDLNKNVSMEGVSPDDVKVVGAKERWAYVKSGGRAVYDMYSRKCNLIQEYSDMLGWIGSYEATCDILMTMSKKTFDELSENAKAWLNIVGIDEAAYPRFVDALNKLKNEDGNFDDINILNPEVAKGNLSIDEIMDIDNIKSLANTIFLDGFDQNKKAKFNTRDKNNLLSEILMTLKHTVYSMGEDDLNDYLYRATPYGTYESKKSAREMYGTPSNWQDSLRVKSVLATGIVTYLAGAAISPLIKSMAENVWRIAGEISNIRGAIQTFGEVVDDEDQSFKNKFVRSVNLMSEFVLDSLMNNIPLSAILSDGNILKNTLGLFKETIDGFLDMAGPVLGLDTEDTRKVLKKLGVDSEYNEYEAGRQPWTHRAFSFIKGLLGDTLFRYEREWLKAFTEEGRDEERARFLRRQSYNKSFGTAAVGDYVARFSEDGALSETYNKFTNALNRFFSSSSDDMNIRAENIYNIYTRDYSLKLQDQEDALRGQSLAMIDELEANGFLDSKTAEATKVKIDNGNKVDDEISNLPYGYQYAIKKILATHEGIKESDEISLKKVLYQEAMRKSELSDMYSKYARQGVPERTEYKTYDDIPAALRMYHKKLTDSAIDISNTEFLNRMNSASGKEWLKSMFDENGNVDIPVPMQAQSYSIDEIMNPQFELTNDGVIKPIGYEPSEEELSEIQNAQQTTTQFLNDEDAAKIFDMISNMNNEPVEESVDTSAEDKISGKEYVESLENLDQALVEELAKGLGVDLSEIDNTKNTDQKEIEVAKAVNEPQDQSDQDSIVNNMELNSPIAENKELALKERLKKQYKEEFPSTEDDTKVSFDNSDLYKTLSNDGISHEDYKKSVLSMLDNDNFTKSYEIKDGDSDESIRKVEKNIFKAYKTIKKLPFYDKLDDVRVAALLDLTYKSPKWAKSFKKAMAAFKDGDFDKAAIEILDSGYGKNYPERAQKVARAIKYGGGDASEFKKDVIPTSYLIKKANEEKDKVDLNDSILKIALEQDKIDPEEYKKMIEGVMKIDFIKKNEGFVDHVYKDREGYDTIGYGFKIDKRGGTPFSDKQIKKWRENGITREEADQVVEEMHEKYKSQISRYKFYQEADPARQAALVDLTYNMGVGWVKDFDNAREAIQKGDYEKFVDEILYNTKADGTKEKTRYYKQTGQRAERVALIMKYGAGDVKEFQAESDNDKSDQDNASKNNDSKIAKN